jgi:hypothetical protein
MNDVQEHERIHARSSTRHAGSRQITDTAETRPERYCPFIGAVSGRFVHTLFRGGDVQNETRGSYRTRPA